jgi:hypothetical protein
MTETDGGAIEPTSSAVVEVPATDIDEDTTADSDRGRRGGRLLTAAALAVLVVVVCVPVWPGLYTVDSQAILAEARQGQVSNWYAPAHGFMWGAVDSIGMPVGVVFAIGVALFVAALYRLLRCFAPPRRAVLGTVLVVLFPPIYGMLGWVGRDVWFTTYSILIVALLFEVWVGRRPGTALTAAQLVALGFLAADARQNAQPVVLLAALAVGVIVARRWTIGRPVLGTIAGTLIVFVAVNALVLGAHRAVVRAEYHPEQPLFIRDLVAGSLRDDKLWLDESVFPSQDIIELRRVVGDSDYHAIIAHPDHPLVYMPYADGSAVNGRYRQLWLDMIRSHPSTYLLGRAELYLQLIGARQLPVSPYFGLSDELGDPQFEQRFPSLAEIRLDLLALGATRGETTLLHAAVIYIGLCAVVLVTLGRDRRVRSPVIALAVTLVAMQGVLFLSVPTRQYRYELFQVCISVALLVAVLLRRRSDPAGTTASAE